MFKKIISLLVIASLLCSSANAGIYIEHIGGKSIRQQSGTSKLLALNTAPFFAPLISNLTLARGTGSPTFTRATTATVIDFEGSVKTALAGEARFTGARRVQNLLASSVMPTGWVDASTGTASVAVVTGQTDPLGGTSAIKVTFNSGGAGDVCAYRNSSAASYAKTTNSNRNSIYARADTPATFYMRDGASASISAISIGTTWTRVTSAVALAFSAGVYNFDLGKDATLIGGTGSLTVYFAFPQAEDVTGQSNQNPSEYVSSVWNDTGATGVRYFEYLNGNTVAANVVTQAQGAAISPSTLQGYLSEIASTNLVWPSGYQVAGVTQTTAPLTAASYTLSFKGTGSITGTGGFVGTLNGTGVNNKVQLTVTATAAAATLTVTGSITEMQLELGSIATSNIPTTTTAATRNADVLTYPAVGNILSSVGSSYAETSHNSPTIVGAVDSIVGTNTSGRLLESPTDTTLRVIDSAVNIATINLLSSWSASFGTAKKIASSWGTGMAVTSEGQTPSVQAAFTNMSTANPIGIGCFGSGTNQIGGNVKNVRIWQIQLPNTTLQAVTTP